MHLYVSWRGGIANGAPLDELNNVYSGTEGKDIEHVAAVLGPCLDELSMLIGIAPSSYKIDLLAMSFYIFTGKHLIQL